MSLPPALEEASPDPELKPGRPVLRTALVVAAPEDEVG